MTGAVGMGMWLEGGVARMRQRVRKWAAQFGLPAVLIALAWGFSWQGHALEIVSDLSKPINLGPHLSYLRDPAGLLSLGSVRSAYADGHFQPAEAETINFGMTADAIWYHLALSFGEEVANFNRQIIELEYVLLNRIDLYIVQADGQMQTYVAGNGIPLNSGAGDFRDFTFPLSPVRGETFEMYFRVQSDTSHQVVLRLWDASTYAELSSRKALWFGLFYGALLTLLIYNLFVAAMVRDVAYVYYIGYLAVSIGFYLTLNGFTRLWFDGGLATTQLWWVSIMVALSAYFSLAFVRPFLRTREALPKLHRVMGVAMALLLASCLVLPFIPVIYGLGATSAVGSIVVLLPLLAGLIELRKGVRIARLFVLAWLMYLLGVASKVAALIGAIEGGFWSVYGMQMGTGLDATLLSLALAHRLHALRRFVPGNVARLALESEHDELMRPSRRRMVICAVDLRGFTAFAATESPEQVIHILKEYYQAIGDVVTRYDATVENFAGDGMVIFFNAPIPLREPEVHAAEAALAMQTAFAACQARWGVAGGALGLGIGLACGEATVGAIGFSHQMQYSAIGPVTNLAARLCAGAKHGEILTTDELIQALPASLRRELDGPRQFKGLVDAVNVWRIVEASV